MLSTPQFFTFLAVPAGRLVRSGKLASAEFPKSSMRVQSKIQSAVLYTAASIAFKDLRELPDESVSAKLRCQQTLPEVTLSPIPGDEYQPPVQPA
jgi:hypothetical protein